MEPWSGAVAPRIARGAGYAALLGGAAYAAATVAGVTSVPLRDTPIGWIGLVVGASLVATSRRLPADLRRPWMLIGLGTLAALAGDAIWAIHTLLLDREPSFPGLPDAAYLLAYPLWLVGVARLPVFDRGTRLRQLLDAVAVGVGLAVFLAYLAPGVGLPSVAVPPLGMAVALAYPLGDLVLVLVAVLRASRRTPKGWRRPLDLLAGAFLAFAVADYLYLADILTYGSGDWYDGLWLAGYGLLALGAASSARPRPVEPDVRAVDRFSLLPYVLVAVVSVVVALDLIAANGDVRSRVLVIGALAVSATVVARQALTIAEIRRSAAAEQRALIGSLSHELRTPLTVVSGFSQILAADWEALSDDDRKRMLDDVASGSRQMASIVTDLLDTSRDVPATVPARPVPLAPLVAEAVRAAHPARAVTVDVPAGLVVHADGGRLIRALANLVANADHYGSSSVLVRADADGEMARIEVHDDGPGIPVRYRRVVWDLFERGAHRLDAEHPGIGSGLPVARAIVGAIGGRIRYEDSPVLGGALLVVHVPLAETSAMTSSP